MFVLGSIKEWSRQFQNNDDGDGFLTMVLRAYFDDSGDDKQERVVAIGGLLGIPNSWTEFEKNWAIATYDLKGPFHSTDCESQRGVFEGWSIEKSCNLMKQLVSIIRDSQLLSFGSIIPVAAYRAVFPNSEVHDPFMLAATHSIIAMAMLARDSAALSRGDTDGIRLVIETSSLAGRIVDVWHRLKSISSWPESQYLMGMGTGGKNMQALQGADLMAREAFKHIDNLGRRPTRKPVRALRDRTSFHEWTAECLEYLRDNGGPNDLELLTHWGQQGKPLPELTVFYDQSIA